MTDRHLGRRDFNRLVMLALTAGVAQACSDSPTGPSTSAGVYTQTDFILGRGAEAVTGSTVTVNYAGWLYDTSKQDGKGEQFDALAGFTFTIGSNQVIKGWDQGVPGMRVGGQRRLIVPPELAYGEQGSGAKIGKNATLVFDIALTGVAES